MANNLATQKLFDVNEQYSESLKQLRISHGEKWEESYLERAIPRNKMLTGVTVLLTGAAGWGVWKIVRAKRGQS